MSQREATDKVLASVTLEVHVPVLAENLEACVANAKMLLGGNFYVGKYKAHLIEAKRRGRTPKYGGWDPATVPLGSDEKTIEELLGEG